MYLKGKFTNFEVEDWKKSQSLYIHGLIKKNQNILTLVHILICTTSKDPTSKQHCFPRKVYAKTKLVTVVSIIRHLQTDYGRRPRRTGTKDFGGKKKKKLKKLLRTLQSSFFRQRYHKNFLLTLSQPLLFI